MFRKRSQILAPVTAQVGKRKLDWHTECNPAFIKALFAKEEFLRHHDNKKPFNHYADAADYQLSSVTMQEGNPVAFFSRTLNTVQRNYIRHR